MNTFQPAAWWLITFLTANIWNCFTHISLLTYLVARFRAALPLTKCRAILGSLINDGLRYFTFHAFAGCAIRILIGDWRQAARSATTSSSLCNKDILKYWRLSRLYYLNSTIISMCGNYFLCQISFKIQPALHLYRLLSSLQYTPLRWLLHLICFIKGYALFEVVSSRWRCIYFNVYLCSYSGLGHGHESFIFLAPELPAPPY